MKMPVEDAQSTLRVILANAMASVICDGFGECEQDGHPLTDPQKTVLIQMAMMNYRTHVEDGEAALRVGAELAGIATATRGRREWATEDEARQEWLDRISNPWQD